MIEKVLATAVIIGAFIIYWAVKGVADKEREAIKVKTKEQKDLEKRIKALNGGTDVSEDWHMHINK
jgi:hypothetical protein